MPPLKNIKHEKFARAVLEKPSATQAYAEAYQVEPNKIAGDSASRIINQYPAVKNRIAELLEKDGVPVSRLNKKLSDLLENDSADVQFRTMRLGYELYGALDRNAPAEGNKEINIQINIMGTDVTI